MMNDIALTLFPVGFATSLGTFYFDAPLPIAPPLAPLDVVVASQALANLSSPRTFPFNRLWIPMPDRPTAMHCILDSDGVVPMVSEHFTDDQMEIHLQVIATLLRAVNPSAIKEEDVEQALLGIGWLMQAVNIEWLAKQSAFSAIDLYDRISELTLSAARLFKDQDLYEDFLNHSLAVLVLLTEALEKENQTERAMANRRVELGVIADKIVLAKEQEDTLEEMDLRIRCAIVQIAMGEEEVAEKVLRKVVRMAASEVQQAQESPINLEMERAALSCSIQALELLGEKEAALQACHRILEIDKVLADWEDMEGTLQQMGLFYLELKRFYEAVRAFVNSDRIGLEKGLDREKLNGLFSLLKFAWEGQAEEGLFVQAGDIYLALHQSFEMILKLPLSFREFFSTVFKSHDFGETLLEAKQILLSKALDAYRAVSHTKGMDAVRALQTSTLD